MTNKNKKIEQLLSQLTLEEKASLLAGTDMWRTNSVDRLGIPQIQMTDGPNGVRGADDNLGSTSICFPVGVAMGATWNPDLIERVGVTLAHEADAKGAHILLAPTVNIQRTPLAGRNFECFSEDPYLSGMMAAAYCNGLQKEGIAACIKHFVCNDQEFERFSISAEVAERPLHEIYLEPFRLALQKANPWSLMSAYNRLNGVFASENEAVLRDILKERWGYDGAVISDWYGTYTAQVPAGGLDLEMPGPPRWMDPETIVKDVKAGTLNEALIDDKVARLIRLMMRVGALTAPAKTPTSATIKPEDSQLARQVAIEATVLLKNTNELLPLDPDAQQTIAIIGENAKWAQIMGGGSSVVNPHYVVSPLTGIQQRVGENTAVAYEIGTEIHRLAPLLDLDWLTTDGNTPGLTLTYFDNRELRGAPSHTAVIQKTFLSWFGTINPFVDPKNFSLRLSGLLTVPETRQYVLHLASIGPSRLLLDGQLVIDNWHMNTPDAERVNTASLDLETGRTYHLLVEYATEPAAPWRMLRLGSLPPLSPDPIQTAVNLATRADVAVIVAGLTQAWETEGFDRADMDLVGRQNELISRVAAANPNTIVVLNVGSPVTMPWLADVPAVLQQWYAGQEAGHALAAVLFGDANPSGKLPTTFPKRLQDNPAYINYPGENGKVHYGEGLFVGYRYHDKKEIEPLFPFGHGLSYTSFSYKNLVLNKEKYAPGDEIVVAVEVTNTGRIAGQDVVQLYVQDVVSRLVRPLQELKAFAKVSLQPGETKTITLTLNEQSLAFYDPAQSRWVAEAGIFNVLIGRSSRDIRLQGQFTWEDDLNAPPEAVDSTQLSTVPTP